MKSCPRCNEPKPLDQFWRDRRTKSGLAVYCIPSGTMRNAEKYRAKAAEEQRATRPWRPRREDSPDGMYRCQRCRRVQSEAQFVVATSKARGTGSYCLTCNSANSSESRARIHGGASSFHLKRRYGIDANEKAECIKDQGGVCLICLRAPAVHVDHDHGTGEIRGMLCFNCNGGLGQFKDDIEIMDRARQYMRGELIRPYRIDAGVYAMDVAPPLGATTVTGPG